MNTYSEYPLLVPPVELATKDRRDWSLKEATAFLTWLRGEIPGRVAFFLRFIGCDGMVPTRAHLVEIDLAFRHVLTAPLFVRSDASPPRLSDAGYAVAADWGLLLATLVLSEAGVNASWEVLRKPKRDASYNLPVLVAPASMPIDPIAVGVAEVAALIRGQERRFSTEATYLACVRRLSGKAM